MIRFVHLVLLMVPAAAWSAPEAREVRYAAQTEVEFERGLSLEGELVRPALRPVFAARQGQFNPLIRLRADFDAEIRESVAEVR